MDKMINQMNERKAGPAGILRSFQERPLMAACAAVLSGILCGIYLPFRLPAAVLLPAAAVLLILLFVQMSGIPDKKNLGQKAGPTAKEKERPARYGQERKPGTADTGRGRTALAGCILLLLFAAGCGRASFMGQRFETPESREFFGNKYPTNEGQFNYALYLMGENICTQEALDRKNSGRPFGEGMPVMEFLYRVKDGLSGLITVLYTPHDAGILKTVLLGERGELPEGVRDLYQSAGISHLLAISGLHLSFLGMGFYRVLRFFLLPVRPSAAVSALFSVLYCLMTGASSSSVRAAVMLGFQFAALFFGRTYDARTGLLAAAVLTALLRPYCIFQTGWQLSFGAAVSICFVSDSLKTKIERLHEAETAIPWEFGRQSSAISGEFRKRDDPVSGELGKRSAAIPLEFGRRSADMSGAFERRAAVMPRAAAQQNAGGNLQAAAARVNYVHPGNRLRSAAGTMLTSLCLQAVSLPVLLRSYYYVPVYAIFLNLLAVPLMALVLAGGVVGILLSAVLRLLPGGLLRAAALTAGPVHYILLLYEMLARFTGALPGSFYCPGKPAAVRVFLYYGLLMAAVLVFLQIPEISTGKSGSGGQSGVPDSQQVLLPGTCGYRRLALLALAAAWLLSASILRAPAQPGFYVAALDVGQGDGFHIHSGQADVLIDCGSSGYDAVGERVLVPYLLSKGITRLDAVFLSHADEDHMNGLLHLVGEETKIRTERLVLPDAARGNPKYGSVIAAFEEDAARTDVLRTLFSALRKPFQRDAQTVRRETQNVRYARTGERFDFGGAELLCLYGGTQSEEDINRNSDFLLLRYGEFSMLFTGDAAAEDEAGLFRLYRGSDVFGDGIDVLKAGHHGSRTSTTDALLKLTRPGYALLSYKKNNRFGHPHREVTERLKRYGTELLATAELGEILLLPGSGGGPPAVFCPYFRK